jgi:quercetin dioxygenase-like cupin family protein
MGLERPIVYNRRSDLLRSPKWLELNTGWGSFRAGHPPVVSDEIRGVLMRMPPAQRSPWHGASGWPKLGEEFPPIGAGAIYLNVQGEVDFSAGGATYSMKPRDMLIVNAVVYSYSNPGSVDALFWTLRNGTMQGRGPGGDLPPSGRVWEGDPSAPDMIRSQPYYRDVEPPHFDDELHRMRLIEWDSYRRGPLEWVGEWGSIWGAYEPVAVDVSARYIRIPPGQASKERRVSHDCMFIGVDEPLTTFTVRDEVIEVGFGDALIIPAKTGFVHANTEQKELVLFELWANGAG